MIRPNKPGSNGKYNSISGTFYPANRAKYLGTQLPIFKSKLEWRMMKYLDSSPSIVTWKYEPTGLRYICGLDQRYHTYYIDFVATIRIDNTKTKKVWIEVKSKRETEKPTLSAKKSKRTILLENQTWIKNQSKWVAAKLEASKLGYEFLIITEDHLV